MRKIRKNKNSLTTLIIIFVISTFTLSVGYSLLYEKLSIQGTGNLVFEEDDSDVTSKYLKFSYTTNSWYSEGKYYYQIDGILENISEYTIENWKVILDFETSPTVQGGWNGEFNLNNDKIIITPVIYNQTINPNSTIAIGLQVIIYSDILEFDKISLYGSPIGIAEDTLSTASTENSNNENDIENENSNDNEENEDISEIDQNNEIIDNEDINEDSDIFTEYSIETSLKAEWKSGENYISQHNLIITNTTDDILEDWQVQITLPQGVSFSQIWEGNYINADGILKISGVEYNKTLQVGASTTILLQFESTYEGFIPEITK